MRKKVLASVLCAAMLMTACTGGAKDAGDAADSGSAGAAAAGTADQGAGDAAGETEAAAASGEKKTLILSTYGLSADISEEEVYTPFEEKYNCEIVTDVGGTNDRYTKLAADSQSTIDVIELSQAMTAKGFDEGLFADIDVSRLENVAELIDVAKAMAEDGQGVAYTINSIGIIYDPAAVDIEIDSYDDLWDPSLEGMVAIPDITTTFGPAMVYMASDHAGVDIKSDQGEAAFQALAELKPNLVKSYAKSADLINMFTSGEVAVALVGDFGVPTIVAANPDLIYISPEGTYANFNLISITKNCKDLDLAYAYLDYRISQELQTKTGKALNEGPTNSKVVFTEEEAASMTYGDVAASAKSLDYGFVNGVLDSWIDQWNRTINN